MGKTLLERVLSLMSEYGISAYQLSKRTGIPQSTVSSWKKRGSEPSRETIDKIIRAYDLPYNYFYDENDEPFDVNWNMIPILGEVPCGEPIEAIEDIKGYIEVLPGMKKDHFALIAKGDSMSPEIRQGDILIVKQGDVPSGAIGIAKVNGDEATCKRIYVTDDGITLFPLNSIDYQPQFFNSAQIKKLPVHVVGKVVEIRRKL